VLSSALSSPFFLSTSVHHRHIHSFPTRRSSDLVLRPSVPELGRHLMSAEKRCGETDWFARRELPDDAQLFELGLERQAVSRFHLDRKSTRLNSSHEWISYAVFCLKKKKCKNLLT